MANRTIGGEAGTCVIGVRRSGEICLVARETVRRRPCKLIIDVAARAGHGHVRACQREAREFRVIECRPHPACRRMAHSTILRECRTDVIGVRCRIKVFRMAPVAIDRQTLEFASDVASCAIELGMHARQREASDRGVIE